MSYSQNFVPQLCTRDGIPAVTFGVRLDNLHMPRIVAHDPVT